MCNEVIYPGELPMGLSTLLSRGPRSLLAAHWRPGVEPPRMYSPSSPTQAYCTAQFRVLSSASAGPRAAVVEDEGLSFLACWSCSTRCHTPPRSSPHSPWPPLLHPRPNKRARPPPCYHVAHAGSWSEVIAGRGAAC
jgi:hypothetical protein